MSIRTLARGDTVFVNAATDANQTYGGARPTWAADSGSGVICRVESLSASEINKYNANGQTVSHRVYFATDQALAPNKHRLHWTKTAGNRVTVDKYLRVTGYYEENNPRGTRRLFVCECNYEAERADA